MVLHKGTKAETPLEDSVSDWSFALVRFVVKLTHWKERTSTDEMPPSCWVGGHGYVAWSGFLINIRGPSLLLPP